MRWIWLVVVILGLVLSSKIPRRHRNGPGDDLRLDRRAEQGGYALPVTGTDFPAADIYLAPAARRRQFAVSGIAVAVLTALAALSYFSGDQHNTTYYLFAAIDLYFIYRLARQYRHYVRGAPEFSIDETGLRLFNPSRLFWPWSRIKGARATGAAEVIVELHRAGGIDQGERDRTEVSLGTQPLDHPAQEIIHLLEAGVRRFGGA